MTKLITRVIGCCQDALPQALSKQLTASRFVGKPNDFRICFDADVPVLVVGLGPKDKLSPQTLREAASVAFKQIKSLDPKADIDIVFENFENHVAVAEGATLAQYTFEHYIKEDSKTKTPKIIIDKETKDWNMGLVQGHAQNIARTLMETPANLMTPTLFCEKAKNLLDGIKNVQIVVRDRKWAEDQKMGSFLSVSNGSNEPLKFLELHYKGGKEGDAPLALVGKGITFDSGGISIKPSNNMALMKGDMGGAAVVLGSFWGIASLQLPINVVATIPLTENMPSGSATKPGDVVTASNGLTIEVDNTDAEGRLVLADAIYYTAMNFSPHSLIELSTLTGAMVVSLGTGYAGVFSNSDKLWEQLECAGKVADDPFWRMPLSDVYAKQIKSNVADLKNVGGSAAGSCTAAIFLKNFIPKDSNINFAHVDIAGVMHNTAPTTLLSAGMTGRPVRSLIEFAKSL
jgi:aminopeptidase